MTLYPIFRVNFHITVSQFVSKLVFLEIWIFIPDMTLFSTLFNICLEYMVTLGVVTDERNCFKAHYKTRCYHERYHH